MGTAPKGPTGGERPEPIKAGDLVLDRYRVIEQIAAGGHSVVFLGKDERLSRPVCIKVFSGFGGTSGVGRTSYEHFVQEAFALSRLTHPNTLRIYDFGHLGERDVEGMPLQVCEYMNAGTLATVVREHGNQSLAETTRVMAAMCAALAEAHALGIVHRDIKPQNILFGTVGAMKLPKLADFGIAKWSDDTEHDDEERAEDTQIVAGQKLAMYSPSWAAPEQLAGQPVSPMTDIYSLAVVAVYMLSSRAIFADEDVYAGYKKRRHADEHVREALQSAQVPAAAVDLLIKALAFDPKQRISNVEDLAHGLAAVAAAGPRPVLTEVARAASDGLDGRSEGATIELQRPRATPSMVTAAPGPGPAPGPMAGPLPGPTTGSLGVAIPAAQLYPRAQPEAVAPAPAPPRPGPGPTGPSPAPALSRTPTPAPLYPPRAPTAPVAGSGYTEPTIRSPWMLQAPAPATGPARPLGPSDLGYVVAERLVHFCLVPGQVVDLVGGQGKIRVTLMTSGAGSRIVHVKGLSCFVSHLGGRPSAAIQLDQPSDISLVTPRAQEIGHIRVAIGQSLPDGALAFVIGPERVALSADDCSDPILFDFGPGSDAYFVYTRGRPVPVPPAPRRRIR